MYTPTSPLLTRPLGADRLPVLVSNREVQVNLAYPWFCKLNVCRNKTIARLVSWLMMTGILVSVGYAHDRAQSRVP